MYRKGRVGVCIWSFFFNGFSEEDWEIHLQNIRDAGEAIKKGEQRVVLSIIYKSQVPSRKQRSRLRKTMRCLNGLSAHAVYLPSRYSYHAVRAVRFLSKTSPFPDRDFYDLWEAIVWLEQHAEIDVNALLEDIRNNIPAENLPISLMR